MLAHVALPTPYGWATEDGSYGWLGIFWTCYEWRTLLLGDELFWTLVLPHLPRAAADILPYAGQRAVRMVISSAVPFIPPKITWNTGPEKRRHRLMLKSVAALRCSIICSKDTRFCTGNDIAWMSHSWFEFDGLPNLTVLILEAPARYEAVKRSLCVLLYRLRTMSLML